MYTSVLAGHHTIAVGGPEGGPVGPGGPGEGPEAGPMGMEWPGAEPTPVPSCMHTSGPGPHHGAQACSHTSYLR